MTGAGGADGLAFGDAAAAREDAVKRTPAATPQISRCLDINRFNMIFSLLKLISASWGSGV
jgi:hypothetical protein